MQKFQQTATPLALKAIRDCLGKFSTNKITHLITVSCTGMSAPGLDLELMNLLHLPSNVCRIAVNFMGCYAVIQALRLADAFCIADKNANVLIVSAELCTLHFQKQPTTDNITSSLLFGDGSAAVLVTGDENVKGLRIENFYSAVDQNVERLCT
jgi:predicted naringenin-chalcone synthase